MPEGPELPDSYYVAAGGGVYEPTWATESPWDTGAQHGGPPSALLGHVMRTTDPAPGLRMAKVTVEFLGPIPRVPLLAESKVVRPGRRVRLLEASLSVDGRTVALARGWEIAVSEPTGTATPATPEEVPPSQPQRFFPGFDRWGYGESIEWRWVHGSLAEPGPGAVWTRMRMPLVAGEPPHPLDRVLLVADSANGISASLPLEEWLFVPTSLTVVTHRHPNAEWVRIEAGTALSGDGHGATSGTLGDTAGPLGTLAQSLYVGPR